MPDITIRRAGLHDAARLRRWRNDPETRAASLSHGRVGRAEHRAWLARTLNADDRWLYIAKLPGPLGRSVPIGMCRFDALDAESSEISVNLSPRYRGKGLATPVLLAAIKRWRHDVPERSAIVATVRSENIASARAFEAAGFVQYQDDGTLTTYRLISATP